MNILDRGHIHEKGNEIAHYLEENYCPTLGNQPDCPDTLAQGYPHLLQVPGIQKLTIQAGIYIESPPGCGEALCGGRCGASLHVSRSLPTN